MLKSEFIQNISIPKVAIIILNWNRADDTIKCLDSVLQLQYANYELIVIDNASTDDSVRRIRERYPNIILIESDKNRGYTGGNNIGIRYGITSGTEYFLIINNDTEVLNPSFLTEMVNKMEKNRDVGIMGPKVFSHGGHRVQNTILFTPKLSRRIKQSFFLRTGRKRKEIDFYTQREVEAISGVCWLIKREVMESIGLLDEDYFMYTEELDYCYRAQKAGWKVMYYPVESIIHYKGPNDENKERNYRQYIYVRRNSVLFLHKHFGFLRAMALASLFFTSNIFKVTVARLLHKEKDFYNASLLAVLFREFKYVLSKEWESK